MAPRQQSSRELQRIETRQRVFDATLVELEREGLAGAGVRKIVTAVGAARV